MDEGQKPFACNIAGCDMTFTNEDHLNCHQKKHDMVLNLGLANKNSELDQTPTPTRFIRNCEEVGLFQDLQNVNPFDETFKKAIEYSKDGTLTVPIINITNDDTLHTPHIFPQIEAVIANPASQFCINNVTLSSVDDEDDSTSDSFPLKIVTNPNILNKKVQVKDKLKQAIQNKKSNSETSPTVTVITVPLKKVQDNASNVQELSRNKRTNSSDSNQEENSSSKKQKALDNDKEKIREMNRAAQVRCRKRKQQQWKTMEEELKVLKNDNFKLLQENNLYQQNFYALKELLVKHKNHTAVKNLPFLKKFEEIVNYCSTRKTNNPKEKTIAISRQKKLAEGNKKLSPILPTIMQKQAVSPQKPLLIQVMGPVSGLALSVLPNNK